MNDTKRAYTKHSLAYQNHTQCHGFGLMMTVHEANVSVRTIGPTYAYMVPNTCGLQTKTPSLTYHHPSRIATAFGVKSSPHPSPHFKGFTFFTILRKDGGNKKA